MEKPGANTQTLSPDPIFQMATGFWVSKTLMSALELEIFSKLSGYKAVTIKELQKILGLQDRPTEVFATALVSLGLLKVAGHHNSEDRRYLNSELAETFLDKDKPSSYMGDFVTMLDKQFYKRWDRLIEALKTKVV